MPKVAVTKRITFSAAHHYWREEWSAEENKATFYACSNQFGHGHNYSLELCVEGEIDPDTGMVVNLTDLKRLLKAKIFAQLDHKYLNHQVPFFKSYTPTLENLALFCWYSLQPSIHSLGLSIKRLTLQENETLAIDYYGAPVPWLDLRALDQEAPQSFTHQGELVHAVS